MAPFLQLAPLHGVTNRHYRAAWFSRFGGFDSAMAPFILAVPGSAEKKNHFKDVLPPPSTGEPARQGGFPPVSPGEPPLIPQILGNDPKSFADTARVLASAGYAEANWNLGCPYPMVAKKFRGSGLLPHPDRIDRFLDAVFREPGMPALSAKIRLGRADPGEWRAFMPVLNRYPLASVAIHGRIGTQMYRGDVDTASLAEAAAACAHPVVYNGDIFDADSFRAAVRAVPAAAGWMLGRGALRDPFLPRRIRHECPDAFVAPGDPRSRAAGDAAGDPAARGLPEYPGNLPPGPPPERGSAAWLEALAGFHDDLYARYRSVLFGPAHALDKMKEVWTYLGYSFPEAKRELAALARTTGFDGYRAAVDAVFAAAAGA